jgi:RNA polymerase sigma-70 factor (ECF subfamily)
VRAALAPIRGRIKVAKFIASFASHWWTGTRITWVEANGSVAALISREGQPCALVSADASAAEIEQIMWVLNPAKLTSISARISTPITPPL